MIVADRRQDIKSMLDLIEDKSELDAVRLVVEGIVTIGMRRKAPPSPAPAISEERAAEYDRRLERMEAGHYLTHEEVARRLRIPR